MSSAKLKLFWLALFLIVILLMDRTYGWGRRRRRRSCATNSCVWHWGSCSRTCGGGVQNPVKTSSQGPCGSCNMPSSHRSCNTQCCAVHCTWRGWSSWGSCSRPCGGGTQTRQRGRNGPSCGGRGCSGSSSESRACNQQCCPVHCVWATWSNWGSCSSTCGGGSQSRSRGYATAASCGGNTCPGGPKESRSCNTQCCPVDCAWSAWSRWSGCTATCGGGNQFRERAQNPVMSCGGATCGGSASESRECNSRCCPLDCVWGGWGKWSGCTKSCGRGTQERNRAITVPAFCGGRRCFGSGQEAQFCNEQCCPVDCRWSEWGSWGSCSKTCERGNQTRNRVISVNSSCAGDGCTGFPIDTRTCNDVCCPTHCQWDEWSAWTGCTKTCGTGRQSRQREVKIAAVCNGEECKGSTYSEITCNTMCCPVDCLLSEWGEWGECSSTCGVRGLQRRQREVTRELSCGGKPCDPVLFEDKPCNRYCFNGGSLAFATCSCDAGWKGECCEHDVNECRDDICPTNSYCVNTDGSYDCVCERGYTKEDGKCIDVDECHLQTHDCHTDAECINILGHYSCLCNPGFTGDGISCEDIDECWLENDNDTSKESSPYDYFTREDSSDDRSPLCHDDAQCSNTYGSYACTCNHGYAGDGVTCADVDECALMKASEKTNSTEEIVASWSVRSCSANSTCTNTKGSYACWCNDGYYGDGFICHEINECESGPCQNGGSCVDLVNALECTCPPGFTGSLCESDIDECKQYGDGRGSGSGMLPANSGDSTSTSVCHADAECINTFGSYSCYCIQGYTGDGVSCSDIDECEILKMRQQNGSSLRDSRSQVVEMSGSGDDGLSSFEFPIRDCDDNALCSNYPGGYGCSCKTGYRGNGFICQDMHECEEETHICDKTNGRCINTDGSHICVCNEGYTGDGVQCADIDECELEKSECDKNHGICTNTIGSHSCLCESGYTGNGKQCSDINECDEGRHKCDPVNGICSNLPGSHACQCKSGFSGNGRICSDIDECFLGFQSCKGAHQKCENNIGNYSCVCEDFFVREGDDCVDKDECAEADKYCKGENELCKNSVGGFQCLCQDGYERKAGQCKDKDECALGTNCKGEYQSCVNTEGSFECVCQQFMFLKDGECKERTPEMHNSPEASPHDSSANTAFKSPAIIVVLGLTVLIIVAIVFVAVRISKRNTYSPRQMANGPAPSTFTNQSFVNNETLTANDDL